MNTPGPAKLDELERRATKVSAKWSHEGCSVYVGGAYEYSVGPQLVCSAIGTAVASHIAAADPATVLALVRVVRAATIVYDHGYGGEVAGELRAALDPFRAQETKP